MNILMKIWELLTTPILYIRYSVLTGILIVIIGIAVGLILKRLFSDGPESEDQGDTLQASPDNATITQIIAIPSFPQSIKKNTVLYQAANSATGFITISEYLALLSHPQLYTKLIWYTWRPGKGWCKNISNLSYTTVSPVTEIWTREFFEYAADPKNYDYESFTLNRSAYPEDIDSAIKQAEALIDSGDLPTDTIEWLRLFIAPSCMCARKFSNTSSTPGRMPY